MNDDYLWDRSGEPDPDVAELERLLSPLAYRPRPAPWRRRTWIAVPLAAAATLLLAASVLWLRPAPQPKADAWRVLDVAGRSSLSPGESLRTGDNAQAALELEDVGRVEIGPSTLVRLIDNRAGHYRLRLERGRLTAYIWAAPGQFFVETPSSLAVDLGCAYTLQVDARGDGRLRVTTGWVGFKSQDRLSLIPEGAVCATRRGVGPGTPHYEDAPPALAAALDTLDFGAGDHRARDAALDEVIALSRRRDALTLWHLLQTLDADQRGRVFDRLAELVPPPAGVTREGVQGSDRRMLDLWWDRLGLGSSEFWRTWERSWTEIAR